MAYENLKQTVNDYEKESINIADDTYNQLTAQMDKTLADIDAFLKTGKEDAATRAAFETAEGNLQSEKLKSSVKTDTAKIMGAAGAGVRSGMAKDTLKKANREYDITSKKAKADIGAYKANAALNISSQKLDVYQNSANMKSDAAAQAYEQIMNDRQFEYKKEQDAIDNALANQKLDLDKQQFEFQKQKLENEKMAAAIGVATNLIQETTIENPETGEKETVQYYDFDQNGEMSAAERSLYVEDKGQRNYLNALKSIGMATSVDEISQSLYNMQTDLFGSGIDRVTGEIASWDNYSGFNDEYAKQLYMNFGLTDAEATEMMHEAKAMCFLNNYASGESGIVLGKKNEDGTYQNEQFYRDGLLSTGISEDRVNEYLDIMKKNWDTSLEFVNEITGEITNVEARQQEIDKEIDSIIPTLNAQKGYEYYWGLVNEQKSLQNQLILIGQSGQYSQEADNLQKRYAEVTNEINKINNRFSGVDLNNKTMSQEYAKADPAYDQVENLRNEKNNLTTLKNQYKDTYWFYTDGSQYGIIDKILSDKIGREKLDDFVGKVTSMMELDQIAAPQILALFTQDKAVGEAVKSVFGEENLQENLVGYLKWCSVLGQQEAMEADYLDGTGVGWKSIAGLSSAIGRLFLSLQAGLANLIEGGVDIWEENNQSLDEYTPNIKSFYQMADLKLQLIQEEASEAMYEINPVWGFIYSTGVSLAQNAATLGIAVAANLILPGAGSAVSAMLMSANSFNDTYNSVRMDGGSASQALTMGIISGAAEYVFEKLSIGKLLDTPAAKGAGKAFWKSMAKASLADMGFNAMEEMNTEIANVIGEVLVLDNLSEYEKQKQYYMNVEGKTDDVAAALAFRDQVGRVLLAGGQGAIAGGVMGGTIARVKMAKAERKVGKAVQKSGNVSSMIKQGLNANADSEAYKIASQLNEKIKNKGKVSNQEVGALARAIAAETQAASAGLSGVDDGISTVSKEIALSNVSSGKVSVSDINTFMPGNEDARAYFKEQTGIELSNNPKTAFAQIVEYVATKTGKTTEQVARELLSNAETSVDVTQKTIASLKSSGNETNVKVAEAFEFLNSEDGVRMLEMQKNNQQPSNGTDAELYQQMLTAKQVIENNRGTLEQGGYEIGTVDFNGIDVPVVVPKGYSDNARAEAVKYVNEQESTANTEQQTGQQTEAKTEKQTGIKTDSENVNKEAQKQLKGSVNGKSGSQSESTQTNSDSNTESKNEKVKKRTITKKNGDTTVIREKETTSKNKAFKKAKQVSRVETVGKTSARYDYTEVDTSNIYDSEMMDEINVAKEIAKAAGAKNIVFISGDVYIDGKKVRAQGFHSIGGTIFVNVDKSSLYARTIGHEVYHQIRQTNKAGLKAYEDIVRNIIEKGESSEFDFGQRVLSSRRAKEIIDAYKNNDSTMSKDALFEEVCAEFAGEIMTNPVVARALAAADTRAGNAFLRMTKKILAKIQGKDSLSNYYNLLSDVEKALVDGIRTSSSKIEADVPETRLQLDEKLGQQISDWYAGLGKKYGSYNGLYFDLGATPSILVRNGAPKSKLIMYDSCVVKVTGGKHAISTDEISKLPSALSDPIFLFEGSVPDSFVAVTELVDQNGNDVVVAVHINQLHKRLVVNKVASLYSKTNEYGKNKIVSYVQNQIQAGNLIELSAKKASTWFTNRGLQLPKLVQTIIDANDSIAQKTKSVNTYSMQKSEKDAQENAKAAVQKVEEAADPKSMLQIEAIDADYDMYRNMLKDIGYSKTDEAMGNLKKIVDLIREFREQGDFDVVLDDMDNRVYSPVKKNSDPLYKLSIDFSTLCVKRLLTQSIIEDLQKAENRVLSKEENIVVRECLKALRDYGMKIDVACAVCYVEAARLRSPKMFQSFIDGLKKDGYENKLVQYFIDNDPSLGKLVDRWEAEAKTRIGFIADTKLKDMTKKQQDKVRSYIHDKYDISLLPMDKISAIKAISGWPVDRFTSVDGLTELKKYHPDIYAALLKHIASGAHAKALEKDTIFRASDLNDVSNAFINRMNNGNGIRMNSWSDFTFRHMADYISMVYALSGKGLKAHTYTKVLDMVRMLGNTNIMFNMSLMTKSFGKGDSIDNTFDNRDGVDFQEAVDLRSRFPETAGTIAISINDQHLLELMNDDRIDYVIPYHSSGLGKSMRNIMGLLTHKDYQRFQSEKTMYKNNANKTPEFGEWFDAKEAQRITDIFKRTKDFAKDYEKLFGVSPAIKQENSVMFPAKIAMQYMAEKYKKLCNDRGYMPKFFGVVIDGTRVSDMEGYWKVLIDRKMINNKTGDIIVQKSVEPNLDIESIHSLMQQELERQRVKQPDEKLAKELLLGFMKSDFYDIPATNRDIKPVVKMFTEKVSDVINGENRANPKSLFASDVSNGATTKFQLEDSKGFEQIRHLYDTVTDEEYSMISEWLKEFDKKHGDQNLYGIVNAQKEKTFASIIKVIDNAKLFNKEAMSFFKDNFDVAYINMETYDNATAYLLDYAGEKLNDVSSRIAGIDTEESSYRALVEQISRDVMETGIGASQSTRDDIFNYVVKKSKKDMANEAKQYEKLSKFFAENKLIANQDTLSVGNTILSMNGTTIDDYYKSLQREFGKEMFPNLSGDKGKVDQIKYYVGMVDDYNISKTILGGKDIDIYNAYVRTVVNDAIDTTEKNMMYAYRIATEPKMAQKDFDAYKLYRQALAEGASGILSLNQKRDDIKSQIKRIEYGSSLSPQAREYLTLVRKNGKKQVSTSNNREAIKEIYSISKKLIDLYDQLGRSDRAITRTLKGRKSAMYTFIKSLIRNPNQYRNLNRAHASLISLENIIDLTMGADAQMFKDIIVAQYSENESARLRALNMYRVPAADAINKYNIDPNSERGIKIGSVIQLLGEGIIVEKDGKYEISKTAPRDMIYYTDKKGGKGFLQSISKEQFNGLKEVESTGLKGKVEKAVSSKTKDRIHERMVDLNEYVNSISNEDMIAVKEISNAMSGVYEDLYRSLTDTLIRNGYPPIKHRANYFPHYIKDGMSTAETIADFVSSFTAGDLPTGVDGNTRDRKPGKKWFGNLLERTGDSTTVNAFVGFDKYLNGASHVIYHTEDIQLRRAAADMLGNKIEMEKLETLYALDTIFDSNDDRREAEGLMEGMRKRLHDDPTYNNTIVTALTRNANAIAGKTTNLDRDFGDIFGRNVLQSIEKFYRFVGRGMVGFNLRSALTNLITIPQLTGTVKMTNIAKAIRDVAQYDALRARNETMEFLESNSSFLYNRVYSQHGKKYSKGYIKDTSQNLSDKNGLWQKYNNAAFAFMNLSDSYTAKVVTAAYYNEAIDRGMTGVQAERFASEGARKLMASRVKGEMPQIFNNRVLGIFTMFQLENSNMFRFLTSDIASYAGTGSGRVGRIIRRLAAFFISEALFEYLLEMLTGSNYRVFSFNPITLVADASAGKKNAMDIMKDLAADIPFIGGAIGEGGRYATSSVIDTWRDLLSSTSKKGIIEFLTGRLSKADYVDISTKLISVLPIAGAGQAKKTIQGIADLSRGGRFGPYTTTNDDGSKSYDEKLYYAIDQEDPANFRAVLFGRSSAKEANEYWNSGLGPLSVQATEGYKEAVNAGMKNTQVYKVYRDASVLRSEISEHNKNNPNKKRNANDEVKKLIRALDATNEQKEILWKNLTTLKNYGSVFSD